MGLLGWSAINFAIYVAIGVFLFRKHGAPALKARKAGFEEHMRRSSALIADAKKQLSDKRERLRSLDAEIAELEQAFNREGDRMVDDVIASAKSSAESILRDVSRRVEAESAKAEKTLRAEVIEKASSLARDNLAASLSDEDDKRLRSDALKGFYVE